ncbi:hypothetical protein MMC12_007726 [Toensbergia leucococca]|nr:hypothetical protein [Toensbergia leucococca]
MKPFSPSLFLNRPSKTLLCQPTLLRSKSLVPHRSFLASATSTPQILTASRTLPYASALLYDLIADIPSYPHFLPFCTTATITSHSNPHPTTHRTYPQAATLHISWGPYAETFTSDIYCAPNTALEAVAGAAKPTIRAAQRSHHNHPQPQADAEQLGGNALFSSLLTRWTLREYPFKPLPPDGKSPQEGNASTPSRARTEIGLVIEVVWASQVYAALSQVAAPKVAGMMVEAFERRAREILGEGEVGGGERMTEGRDGGLERVIGERG